MKYHTFIMILNYVKRIYVDLLILFIAIALQSPIYHQHVDLGHHDNPVGHTGNIIPHHTNDSSIDLHGTDIFQDALPEKNDHSHNHAHFEKDLFRTTRTENITVDTASVYGFVSFDIVSKRLLSFGKFSYSPNTAISYGKIFARTSSGLSPPVHSS